MSKPSTIDKFRDHLWDDVDTLPLTLKERDQLLRYRGIFSQKLANPTITNTELAIYLQTQHGITSEGQAYRDISHAEILLGDIRSSEKAWVRYLVYEKLKKALQMAEDKSDIKSMIKAAEALGKFARLDQEDQDPIPYEDIVPQPIEYVNDPSVVGLPAVENPRAIIDRVKKKYMDDIEVVSYEEVKP